MKPKTFFDIETKYVKLIFETWSLLENQLDIPKWNFIKTLNQEDFWR